ncbi:MAG: redoxin domain-containing protein [Acidobacteria bacterium]|nr:redoxin domain-containing protein [Acidobacteriota bacterium]
MGMPAAVGPLSVLLATLVSQAPMVAQLPRTPIDLSKLGPQVGERVPDFTLTDQNGKTWTLQSVMGPKGAMLVFYRSADW